eukprot:780271_1
MVMLAQAPPTHFQLKFIFHIHRIPLLFRRSPATNTCCKIHFITTTTTTAIVTIANSCYTCIAVTIWTDSTPNASPYLPGMRWTALTNAKWFSGTMTIIRALHAPELFLCFLLPRISSLPIHSQRTRRVHTIIIASLILTHSNHETLGEDE